MSEPVAIAEPEKGDSLTVGRGGMLREAVLCAYSMGVDLNLVTGSRIAILLPNGPSAVVWIEAAKRCGIVFCAVAAGTAASSVASRLVDVRRRQPKRNPCAPRAPLACSPARSVLALTRSPARSVLALTRSPARSVATGRRIRHCNFRVRPTKRN